MRIGVPKGFAYYTYKPFIETFFSGLGIPVKYSEDTDEQVLKKGISCCVDEACFPVKLFHGHTAALAEECDVMAVPRIMKTEYGESICPKVSGMPDLVAQVVPKEKMIFHEPLYLNDQKSLRKALWKDCKKLGVNKLTFKKSFLNGLLAQEYTERGIDDEAYTYRVFLGGHPYNLYDSFANLDVLGKLHHMDIGVITEERIPREEKESGLAYADLMKKPYWTFFINHFGSIKALRETGIDGVVYLSSFSCGTDSFTVEMLKNNLEGLPFLVLKLDEQRGQAGVDTRLEAFAEVLKARRKK